MEITSSMWGRNDYDVYLFFASWDVKPLWHYDVWMRLVPALTPLMQSPRGKTSVRLNQFGRQPGRDSPKLKFGHIYWNEKGHGKWTHNSPVTGPDSLSWKLDYLSAFAPGMGYCKDRTPDSQFAICNPMEILRDRFYQYIAVLCLDTEIFAENEHVPAALASLRECTGAVLAAKTKRVWHSPKPLYLTDAAVYHLYGLTRHTGEPALDVLKGKSWEQLRY